MTAVAATLLLTARAGRAQEHVDDETAQEQQEMDKRVSNALAGLGTELNFRGVGHDFAVDGVVSTGNDRDAVEAGRATARVLVFPALAQSSATWGLWIGVRTGWYRFETAANPTDAPPGGLVPANVEPLLGLIEATPSDALRLDVDVAPVLSTAPASVISSQAALVAALATSPHDDLLFLPNIVSAARLRARLSRRWDPCAHFSVGVRAEAEIGYAETQTSFGTNRGEAGGGEVDLDFYWRPRWRFGEGFVFEAIGEIGYTSVWRSDVVLPLRVGGRVAWAATRSFELGFGVTRIASSLPPLGSFSIWATSLDLRWTFDQSEKSTWTRRAFDVQPDLANVPAP
jgi:hypothetical protein